MLLYITPSFKIIHSQQVLVEKTSVSTILTRNLAKLISSVQCLFGWQVILVTFPTARWYDGNILLISLVSRKLALCILKYYMLSWKCMMMYIIIIQCVICCKIKKICSTFESNPHKFIENHREDILSSVLQILAWRNEQI